MVIKSLLDSDGYPDNKLKEDFIRSRRRSFQEDMQPEYSPVVESVEVQCPVHSDQVVEDRHICCRAGLTISFWSCPKNLTTPQER